MQPNYFVLAVPGFFFFMGLELWLAKRRRLSVFRLSDTLTSLSCGTLYQFMLAFTTAGILAGYAYLYEHHHLLDLSPKSPWVWFFGFLAVDFTYYWWHRISHRVNLFWAAHVVHHSSEDFNFGVAMRQSVLTPFTAAPFSAMLALAGLPPVVYGPIHVFNIFYQFWIHTQLIGKLGWFERIFNSPSLHRVHHGINPRYLDKNYGGTTIIWDRLFGTWEPESEPTVYGVVKPLSSFNPLWAQFHYCFEIVRLVVHAPSIGDKVRAFFNGPLWYPAGLPAPAAPAPVSPATFEKYDPELPASLRRYVCVQYTVLMLLAFVLLLIAPRLSIGALLAAAAVVALSLVSIGALLEGKSWARPIEGARLVLLLGTVAAGVILRT